MKIIVIFALLCVCLCQGYRILGVFPFHGRSHFVMFEQLMKGLASKGHQVDVVSTFPQKRPFPNYTDIVVLEPPPGMVFLNNFSFNIMKDNLGNNPIRKLATNAGNTVCENALSHPEVKRLAFEPSNPPYDLVLMEIFSANCFVVFGHLLKAPVIGVTSVTLFPWFNHMISNPMNLAFAPSNMLNLPDKMTFYDRLHNFVHSYYNKLYFEYLTRDAQDAIIRENFGDGMPSLSEMEKSIALIISNSHVSLNGARPTTPALVEVGGLHVQDNGDPLEPELQKWLDDSKDGFVYFSFGSMMKIESFPRDVLEIFYKSLSKISPIRVLMKIPNPGELPPGLPKNVHTRPWTSQLKVLKHPNVKAFITHGGLMGTQEAIHCGVPMIGFPLFGDQFSNIDNYVKKKIAIRLDHKDITEEKMDAALKDILHDPIYRESARKLGAMFKDRPLNALDTAIFWIEYVIKYGGDSLKSPAMDYAWWQIELLDIYAFFIVVGLSALYVFYKILRVIVSSFSSSSSRGVSKLKKTS